MDKFVSVRLVQANALDLTLFQFDFDLTFAVFFLNADGTIYGRYGTRSDPGAVRDISLEGFKRALEGALELHAGYPGNKASLQGKRALATRYKRPGRYPALRKYEPDLDYRGNVVKSCMHCHQIREAERQMAREARKPMSDEMLFPWPLPDTVGLTMDPKARARVAGVTKGSAAERAGFAVGDEIRSLAGQPLLSTADLQWVLHRTKGSARLPAVVARGDASRKLTLVLEKSWRDAGDIGWRVSTWDLRRMAFGGMVLEPAPDADGKRMRLRAKHVGRYGNHAVALRAGARKGDIVTSFAGQTRHMTESELLRWVLRNRPAGTRVPVTLERGGKTIEIKLRLQ